MGGRKRTDGRIAATATLIVHEFLYRKKSRRKAFGNASLVGTDFVEMAYWRYDLKL